MNARPAATRPSDSSTPLLLSVEASARAVCSCAPPNQQTRLASGSSLGLVSPALMLCPGPVCRPTNRKARRCARCPSLGPLISTLLCAALCCVRWCCALALSLVLPPGDHRRRQVDSARRPGRAPRHRRCPRARRRLGAPSRRRRRRWRRWQRRRRPGCGVAVPAILQRPEEQRVPLRDVRRLRVA